MENVNSEFRKKLKNLLTKLTDIFERNGKLRDVSINFMLMNQYNLLRKD